MKITIDTKEDSKEEIERAIHLLSSLVRENRFKEVRDEEMRSERGLFSSGSGNSSNPESSNNAFVNMFGGGETAEEKKEEKIPVDLSILSSTKEENEREEVDEEVPRVVSY